MQLLLILCTLSVAIYLKGRFPVFKGLSYTANNEYNGRGILTNIVHYAIHINYFVEFDQNFGKIQELAPKYIILYRHIVPLH